MAVGKTALVLLGVALLLVGCENESKPLKVRIGQIVPPLVVQDLNNQPTTLRPNPGKLLMINVWATWCGPCRHEMPSLQRLAAKLGSEGVDLVGLSVDQDEHVVREYLIEHDIHFPSVLDRQFAAVNGILGVRVFPSTFFLSSDGTLLKVIEGWRDWDTPEMVADIQSLLPARAEKPQKLLE